VGTKVCLGTRNLVFQLEVLRSTTIIMQDRSCSSPGEVGTGRERGREGPVGTREEQVGSVSSTHSTIDSVLLDPLHHYCFLQCICHLLLCSISNNDI
jgi:hypothetical protein